MTILLPADAGSRRRRVARRGPATRTAPVAAARPRLTVDLQAVAANTRHLAARTPGTLMAVVKADGFGHGALDVALTALDNGARWLGVTSLAEAFALRDAGLTAPVLAWLNPVDADFRTATELDVDVAVADLAHLAAAGRTGRTARVHLHLDTGMARDGAAPDHWRDLCLAARAAERAGRVRVVGVMGHLACADRPGDPANAAGRRAFAWGVEVARTVGLDPTHRHLAATAATLTDPSALHTMSRVGAGLVGIDPSGTTRMRPAMTLTAPVVGVRQVRAGTEVGYGHDWAAAAPTTLALLPLGYADGLPRVASGRAHVAIRGRRHPVVGRISMDQVVVDVGDTDVRLGETATVFGPGGSGEPTAAEWARWAGTIEHEIVTGIGARVARS